MTYLAVEARVKILAEHQTCRDIIRQFEGRLANLEATTASANARWLN